MSRWSSLLLLLVAAVVSADDRPPTTEIGGDASLGAKGPEVEYGRLGPQPLGTDALLALQKRWEGAGRLRLSSQSFWADDTHIEDGVCGATLRKGILIPILSGGEGGVPERRVGLVFVGEGDMALSFPERASAWSFANHMVLHAGADKAAMAPIAHQEKPFTDAITRAVLFSADPVIEGMLKGLDPVGGGMVERAHADGVDAELVVTSSKGEVAARAIARDLLAERRDELLKSGFDPVEMLRFDRMVNEELGTPGDRIRLIADFRTETRFAVASGAGATIGVKGYDKWLTCYRDGTDHRDTGLRATAFAHGTDPAGNRHLFQFSGQPFPVDIPGAPSQAQTRIEAVRAHVDVELSAERNLNEVGATVKSKLVLRAREEGVRHVIMRLPRHEALDRTFGIDQIAMADGTPVGWLELDRGLPRSVDDRFNPREAADAFRDSGGGGGASGGGGGGGGIGASSSVAAPTDASGGNLATNNMNEPAAGTIALLNQRMARRQEVLIVLARPLKYGEEVELLVDWKARWPFANWSQVSGGMTGETMANLGSTTGQRSLVPELLPTLGGTPWDFTAKVSLPPRRLDLAVTGQTTKEYLDDGGWSITETAARGVRRPSLAVGRWKTQADPPAAGLPGVRVHVFGNAGNELAGLAPEVRRVLVFLRRFLPIPSAEEIDVFQSRGRAPQEAFTIAHDQAAGGMVSFQKMATAVIGNVGSMGDDPSATMKAMVARQVASQVWGQVVAPASERDAWLTAALSDTYGAYYVRAAMQEKGFEAFEDRIERVRKAMEDPVDGRAGVADASRPFMSLTDGGQLYYNNPQLFDDYAFFLFGRVLRERLGDYNYFRALDRFARQHVGQRVTTVQLREAMEALTGADLRDFFDYWVHGGFIPKLTVEWRQAPMPGDPTAQMLLGCVVSDVPFGRFDVPVAILDQDGKRRVAALVDVEDGLGGFSVLRREGKVTVEVDPQNQILAYKRKVDEVKKTRCEE